IAADYTPGGQRRELIYTSRHYQNASGPADHKWVWDTVRIDDTPEVDIYDVSPPGDTQRFDLNFISMVDLRFGVVVTDGYENGLSQTSDQRYVSKVHVDGVAVHTELGPLGNVWLGPDRIIDTGLATFVPSSPLYLLDGAALTFNYIQSGCSSSGGYGAFARPSLFLPVNVPASERRGAVGHTLTNQATHTFVYQFWNMNSGDVPLSLAAQDARGYRTPCSLAFDGGRLLISYRCFRMEGGYGARYGPWGAPALFRQEGHPTDPAVFFTKHYATDTTLPDLTGVGGDGARYAPIWQFGAYPQPS